MGLIAKLRDRLRERRARRAAAVVAARKPTVPVPYGQRRIPPVPSRRYASASPAAAPSPSYASSSTEDGTAYLVMDQFLHASDSGSVGPTDSSSALDSFSGGGGDFGGGGSSSDW